MRRSSKILASASFAALVAAAAHSGWTWRRSRALDAEGTRLTVERKLPRPMRYVDAAAGAGLPAAAAPAARDWRVTTSRRALSSPVVLGDLAYVGTAENYLECFDPRTGEPVWRLRKNYPVRAEAAFLRDAEGDLLFSGEGGESSANSALTAVRAREGTVLWQREFRGHLSSPPAVEAEVSRLYVSTGPSGVWALGARDGSVLWHSAVGHADFTPLLLHGLLVVVSQPQEAIADSRFQVLNPETGEPIWALELPGLPAAPPVASPVRDEIVVTTTRGAHAVSLVTRALKWSRELPGPPLRSTPVLNERKLAIVATRDGTLLALNAETGKTEWAAPTGGEILAPPSLKPGETVDLLAVLGAQGRLALYDALTGERLGSQETGKGSTSAPLFYSVPARSGAGAERILVATPELMGLYRYY